LCLNYCLTAAATRCLHTGTDSAIRRELLVWEALYTLHGVVRTNTARGHSAHRANLAHSVFGVPCWTQTQGNDHTITLALSAVVWLLNTGITLVVTRETVV
jgi:hypothetical protein